MESFPYPGSTGVSPVSLGDLLGVSTILTRHVIGTAGTRPVRHNDSHLSPRTSHLATRPRAPLAYILSASHSGSTLLAMLLGSHPDICTVGEMKGVRGNSAAYRCSCGALIRECNFWQEVNEGMVRRGLSFEITCADTNIQNIENKYVHRLIQPLHRGPVFEMVRDLGLAFHPQWHAHLKKVQARNAALVRTLLEVSGAATVVDSSKVGLRLKYLLRNPELDIRVLRLVRDGRAVSLTHTNPAEFADAADPRLRSGGSGLVRPDFRLPMREAALLWRHSNEEADRITSRLPRSQWMEVRYEQLCQNPDETLRAICGFLGLNPLSAGENFRQRKQQHVVGNGMRFDSTSEIRLDERWKTCLSAQDLNVFNAVAGDLNRLYGYA